MSAFTEVTGLAGRQHGLVERSQVLACGVAPGTVQRWLDAGRLEPMHRGVYRLAGAPASWHQRVAAAVLSAGTGAVASHRSAARLWELAVDEVVEVSVPRERAIRLRGVVVHRTMDLDETQVGFRRGIRVTNPLRTLVDLGAVSGSHAVEDALDRGLERRLISTAAVDRALQRVARRGRAGAGVLRGVLEERALGAARPDGLLEPRMARLLRASLLPEPSFQHRVRVGGRVVARIDFAYPDRKVAVEVDGFESHATPRALQWDLDRQNVLVGLGWTVLRFTWGDVVRRPEKVVSDLRHVLGRRNTGERT